MNVREIVESQLTQRTQPGRQVSGSADFALFMSLFSQPGPSVQGTADPLNQHEPHAVTRPIQFTQSISSNPTANIALLKALSQEPLAVGGTSPYDAVEAVDNLLIAKA
ncbi:hypothetical protein [Marinomonas balearica]|uniref:Uncharacterized protein n=1 Tax=Marinomonas balearica TaxID=491947 RepID=A0A4R6M9U1_9GAMM|nr:hypothetical protein [Marinomonas balearica]TDO98213.1 hypothetical protein DFP79_1852 [Marinomonas balearica]